MVRCPNVNQEDWKDIVAAYGQTAAMKAFMLNGEELPTLAEAKELLKYRSIEDKGSAIIEIVRHGATALNSENNGGVDRIRGHKDIPLSPQGLADATKAGEALIGKIDKIVSSDLERTRETAQIISNITGAPIERYSFNLRPWNMGSFQGKPSEEVIKVMDEYIKNPDVSMPRGEDIESRGESFNTFKDRFLDEVRRIRDNSDGQSVALVTHYRGLKLLEAWKAAGEPENNNIDLKAFLSHSTDDKPGVSRRYQINEKDNNYERDYSPKKEQIATNLLKKLYPNIKLEETLDTIKDPKDQVARGVTDTKAGTILVNSLIKNTDTISHEYAHNYIDWFENTPIVKQGIKLFGNKEDLVDAIGKGTIKAQEWYNRFYNWIKGLFNKKQAVLNELIRDFTTAKDLGDKSSEGDIRYKQEFNTNELRKEFKVDKSTYSYEDAIKRAQGINKYINEHRGDQGYKAKVGLDATGKNHIVTFVQTNQLQYQKAQKEKLSMEEVDAKYMGNQAKTREQIKTWGQSLNQTTNLGAALQKAFLNLDTRIGRLKQRGFLPTNEQKVLDKLINDAKTLNVEQQVVRVIAESLKTLGSSFDQYIENISKGDFTMRGLQSSANWAIGYGWLDDIKDLIMSPDSGLSKEFKEEIAVKSIDEAITKRDQLISGYMKRGCQLFAKSMSDNLGWAEATSKKEQELQYNKLPKETRDLFSLEDWLKYYQENNSDMLKEQNYNKILKELEYASRDINFFERWLDNTADSPDIIMATVAASYKNMLQQINIPAYKIRNEILDHVVELEKQFHQTALKKPFVKMEDMYDAFIEKDEKGKSTGYRVDKFYSKLKSDINDKYKELSRTNLSDDEIARKFSDFKDMVAPRDNVKFYQAKEDFVNKLLNNHDITEAEANAIKLEIRKPVWKLRLTGQVGLDTSNRFSNWEAHNDDLFRNPIEKYRNPQFDFLKKLSGSDSDDPYDWKSDDARVKFYKLITRLGDDADDKVGNKALGQRLPTTLKTSIERLKSGDVKGMFSENFRNQLWKVTPDEDIQNKDLQENPDIKQTKEEAKKSRAIIDTQGRLHRTLPLHYTARLDPKDMSFDLATSYMGYYYSALKYEATNKILPELDFVRDVFDQRKVTATDKKGKPLEIDTKNSNILDRTVFKSKSESRIKDQYEDWLKLVIYGEANAKTKADKIIGTLGKYTGVRVLGFNMFSALNYVFNIETLQKVEAFAGQHLKISSLNKASYIVDKDIPQLMLDAGKRRSSSLTGLLAEEFRLMNDEVNTKFRKSTIAQNLWTSNKIFFMLNSGLFWMQSRFILGMLNDIKAYDSEGKPIMIKPTLGDIKSKVLGKEIHASILDMYSIKTINRYKNNIYEIRQNKELEYFKNNKQISKREYENIFNNLKSLEYTSDKELHINSQIDLIKSKWTEKDQLIFGGKLKFLLRQMHGSFDVDEASAIRQFAVGRMIEQFRKYIMPGMKRRWSKEYYNNALKDYTEGNYRTFARWIGEFASEISQYKLALLTDPKNSWKGLNQDMFGKFTNNERANIKRSVAELGVLTGIIVMMSCILPALSHDDDQYKNKQFRQEHQMIAGLLDAAKYCNLRLLSEWTMYINPVEGGKILDSPAATYGFLQDWAKLITCIGHPGDNYLTGVFKGQNKMFHKFKDLVPGLRQIYKFDNLREQGNYLKEMNIFVGQKQKKVTNTNLYNDYDKMNI